MAAGVEPGQLHRLRHHTAGPGRDDSPRDIAGGREVPHPDAAGARGQHTAGETEPHSGRPVAHCGAGSDGNSLPNDHARTAGRQGVGPLARIPTAARPPLGEVFLPARIGMARGVVVPRELEGNGLGRRRQMLLRHRPLAPNGGNSTPSPRGLVPRRPPSGEAARNLRRSLPAWEPASWRFPSRGMRWQPGCPPMKAVPRPAWAADRPLRPGRSWPTTTPRRIGAARDAFRRAR